MPANPKTAAEKQRAAKAGNGNPSQLKKSSPPSAMAEPDQLGIHPGSALSVTHFSLKDVIAILSQATALEAMPVSKRAQLYAKRRVALLFYESSTRTRTSFELAAKSLGADTVLVSALSSSIEKGESLKDTGITLRALGAECIILRHANSGAPYLLAQTTGLPILNAGDGTHAHPSQALLDLRTILAHLHGNQYASSKRPLSLSATTLAGLTVTIAGDILHSRVARSNALLLPKLGAKVIFCGPEALLPAVAAEIGPGVEIERDFERALSRSDVVMMLRIQRERLAGLHLDLENYVRDYQLHVDRLEKYSPKALVMHPGPMIRGLEISSEVADGPNSAIAEQVRHGTAIRMALLARALDATSKPKKQNKKTGGKR